MDLTKEQFRELLLTFQLGRFVKEPHDQPEGTPSEKLEQLEDALVREALNKGYEDLVQDFQGKKLSADDILEEQEEIMEWYHDDEFWFQLVNRLGKRDFFRQADKETLEQAEKDGWLPEKVHEFYEKYDQEFEEHGVERLEVVED